MKYVIVIMDGAADEPLAELDGMTVLEKAHIPHADWISMNGALGIVKTVPDGYNPGSDVAQMSLLGYDPKIYYTGRAPLEAAALGIKTTDNDWIFRCNLVTVADGVMEDYSAGHIATVEAAKLINDLNEQLGNDKITFYPGVSYRHLMVCREGNFEAQIPPPHDIMDQPISKHLPRGKGGKELCKLMERAAEILSNHDVNRVRKDLGENPATNIWLWGQGHRPQLDSFSKRFGIKAAVITAVDLLRGLGRLTSMDVIEIEGATAYLDTNYEGKGQGAIEALSSHDLVIVHIEAPDEAGHGALVESKIEAIEQIDKLVTGPLLKWLKGQDEEWRIMILPDHPTPIRTRTHSREPVPFAIAGTGISSAGQETYSETKAVSTGMRIEKGHELMEFFLKGKG